MELIVKTLRAQCTLSDIQDKYLREVDLLSDQ